MSMKKWRLLLAAELMLAGGALTGDAGAQQFLPAVRDAAPAPACVSCARPTFPLWHRAKDRWDRWFAHDTTDAMPLGQSLYQTMSNQIDNGIAARMILNDFDFEQYGVNLNVRGKDKLPRVLALAMQYPYFIIVERTNYEPALAELRRQTLIKELARLSIPVSPDRIVVGAPLTPGLNGVEAELLYQSLLNQTMSGGSNLGSSFGKTGALPGAGIPMAR